MIRDRIYAKLRQMRVNYSVNHSISYSQCGEDLILKYLSRELGIKKVSYLDLGAYHPTYLSNTYLFYLTGGQGVCVEANPNLIGPFRTLRKRDRILNCGVSTVSGHATFYTMSLPTLSTFSKEEAERFESYGSAKIERTDKVDTLTVNEIIANEFTTPPNLVSLDIEGMDFTVLKNFDFDTYRPEMFCVETLTYTEDKTEQKISKIIDLMINRGYKVYADTYINTIFVDKAAWENRI